MLGEFAWCKQGLCRAFTGASSIVTTNTGRKYRCRSHVSPVMKEGKIWNKLHLHVLFPSHHNISTLELICSINGHFISVLCQVSSTRQQVLRWIGCARLLRISFSSEKKEIEIIDNYVVIYTFRRISLGMVVSVYNLSTWEAESVEMPGVWCLPESHRVGETLSQINETKIYYLVNVTHWGRDGELSGHAAALMGFIV